MPQFQYKRQQFQQEAVAAVADMFRGVNIGRFQQPPDFRLAGNFTPPPPRMN